MQDESTTPRVITVTLADQGNAPAVDHGTMCCATMTVGGRKKVGAGRFRKPGKRMPCNLPATWVHKGKPYCAMHGPSRHRIDPYYDTPEWRALRQQTLQRDGHRCRYCNNPAHQADHVVPRRKGGPDDLANLVACCRLCNRLALNAEFPSFAAKKAWMRAQIAAMTKNDRRRPEPRPTAELDAFQKIVEAS